MNLSIPNLNGALTPESAVAFQQSKQQMNLGLAVLKKQMDVAKTQTSQMQQLLESSRALSPAHIGKRFDGFA